MALGRVEPDLVVHRNLASWQKKGDKKRETLNVVPMGVTEKDGGGDRFRRVLH